MSSRWWLHDKKRCVEGVRRLDIRRLQGYLFKPCLFTVTWSDGGKLQIEAGEDNTMTLSYRCQINGGDWELVRQRVAFEWTPCNYGGQRAWFLCPSGGCTRRVAILYGAGKYFYCRHCYNLCYATQQETEPFRLLTKAQRKHTKLGNSGSVLMLPEKPKGMRWKTYWRLIEEAQSCVNAGTVLILARHDPRYRDRALATCARAKLPRPR